MKNVLKKLTGARDAVTATLDELDVLRAAIATKKTDVEALRRAPIPVSEALEQFDRWAADKAADAIDRLRPEHLVDPAHPAGELRLPDFSGSCGGRIPPSR